MITLPVLIGLLAAGLAALARAEAERQKKRPAPQRVPVR